MFVCTTAATKPRERNNEQRNLENETTKQTMRDETWTSRMQRNKWWEMSLERWREPMMKMRDATKRDERCNFERRRSMNGWEMNLERWGYPMMKMRDETKQTMRDTTKMQQNKRWEMQPETMRDDPWTMKIDERYSTINISRDEL